MLLALEIPDTLFGWPTWVIASAALLGVFAFWDELSGFLKNGGGNAAGANPGGSTADPMTDRRRVEADQDAVWRLMARGRDLNNARLGEAGMTATAEFFNDRRTKPQESSP